MDAAFYLIDDPGLLGISGDDREDFLQRQTSNDVRLLAPGRSVLTVLTTPAGRILDVLTLLHAPDTILAITLAGYAGKTARFLKGRIFFMDKVGLKDQSANTAQVELMGKDAAAMLGLPVAPAPDTVLALSWLHPEALAVVQQPAIGAGLRLCLPLEALPALLDRLTGAGARALSAADYDLLRIENGLPSGNRELTDAFTPFETGLQCAVSSSKGCYTGQEVLARQVSYDKVTQSLVGLRLESAATPGMRLWIEGRAVGSITSAALSPRFGPIGLGVVKRPHQEPGTRLALGSDTPSEDWAEVVQLPFERFYPPHQGAADS